MSGRYFLRYFRCLAIAVTLAGMLNAVDQVMAQEAGKNFSPYADRRNATQVYWGDQHQHTSFSPDAGLVGDRLSPDDSYRFARGEQLRSSTGQLVRLIKPYDWLVVADHAEFLGLPQAFLEKNPAIMQT